MKDIPASLDYVYSKANKPQTDEEKAKIEKWFPGLSMASAVSSLLYISLNTRIDILWVVNKLAKSSSNPGLKNFKALMHCFGYLRKYIDMGIRFYANEKESPVYQLCQKNGVDYTDLIGFSDSSWQDYPDTGKSTGGYKVFCQGGLIEANSTMPVPIALSSAEAEYMSCNILGAMFFHLRELLYEFENLGKSDYDINGLHGQTPSIVLIDNQATVSMSKNYKVTAKNRHVGRCWHFVRRGVQAKLFKLQWIPAEDQLADDLHIQYLEIIIRTICVLKCNSHSCIFFLPGEFITPNLVDFFFFFFCLVSLWMSDAGVWELISPCQNFCRWLDFFLDF